MVSCFVLDYMHLACLGVMRKMLVCWKSGPIPHRLGKHNILEISDRLISFKKFVPSEFNRKPRSLQELDYFKASELRTFLLYLGPVVLRDVLSTDKYNHFILLSVSIRILLSENNEWYDYARELLRTFVSHMSSLYVPEFMVYNVHSLIHLADDAKKYGSLEKISALGRACRNWFSFNFFRGHLTHQILL